MNKSKAATLESLIREVGELVVTTNQHTDGKGKTKRKKPPTHEQADLQLAWERFGILRRYYEPHIHKEHVEPEMGRPDFYGPIFLK